MNKKTKVVIIIPTYNEALVIEKTLENLSAELKESTDFEVHFLVFDSNSQDETVLCVKNKQKTLANVSLISEPTKSGLGSAYHQAMSYAMKVMKADVIVEYDADGSHQACYILPMLRALSHAEVVVGSRYVEGGSLPNDWGLWRTSISKIGNWVARRVLSLSYRDYTSGFRATKVSFLKGVWPSEFLSNNYAYKIHLFWLLHLKGARILEYPIAFIDRKDGESKLPANSIMDTLRVLKTLWFWKVKAFFSKKKLLKN